MKLHGYLLAAMLLAGAAAAQAMPGSMNIGQAYFSSPERYASYEPSVLDRNYASCLGSEIDGVVESALAHVIKMKLAWPEQSFPKVENAVRKLSVNGRTMGIRYRAQLSSMVLDNIHTFEVTSCKDCVNPESLFESVAQRLQQTALSAK